MIPGSILNLVAEQLDVSTGKATPLSGGDINRAAKLETGSSNLFVKWNHRAPADMFEKEAKGLELLRSADSEIVVPKPLLHRPVDGDSPGFLVMEYFAPASGSSKNAFRFGAQLAKLHQTGAEHFGLDHNNYIGRLPQYNSARNSWPEFYADMRITPQIKMAVDSGLLPASIMQNSERFYAECSSLFPDTAPSLVHGDLWGGNYFFDASGSAVLIDPAVYFGHPEMDLAFSKMFGGFSNEFYRGYEAETPLEPGFEIRIELYNLYPLLVHANLFGGGYATQARRFLERY